MKTIFLCNTLVILILANNYFATCNSSNQNPGQQEILRIIEGNWILFQNPKISLIIKRDTLNHYYNGKLEEKSLIRISDTVISRIFENDTIKGNKGQFFFEELNIATKEVESQYTIISYSKNKFVLSPLHTGQLLTYNRKK